MGGLSSISTGGNILSLDFVRIVMSSDANIDIIANSVYFLKTLTVIACTQT